MSRKSALRFLRILGTTALLVYALGKAGLFRPQGWQDLLEIFAQTRFSFLLASLGMTVLLNFASSVKWYMLSRSRGLQVSLWRLFAYYVVGKFFNLVLPSSIGGDVVRMHELGRYTGRYADATAVVFVERFSGLATLVMLALIAVVVNLQIFNLPWLTIALVIGSLGMAFMCWLIIDQRPFQFTKKVFASRLSFLDKLLTKIEKFRKAVLAYKDDPSALWWALINSLIFYFLAVVNVWVSILAFSSQVSFVSILVAVPVIMFIMNIPFSIGGIGLMEFAYSFTLGLFGITPTVAISTALLMRAKTLVDAGLGGILYPMVSEGGSGAGKLSKSLIRRYEKQVDE